MIEALGFRVIRWVEDIYRSLYIFYDSFRSLGVQLLCFRFRFNSTLNQTYLMGVESFFVMVFALTCVSLMLTIEFSYHMKMVLRQDSLVPAFSTVLMLRELGPVVSCLLLNARVGASIAAEIGSMKNSDQIDALSLLGISPVEFLTVPRWIACLLSCLTLSVISVGVGIMGGALIASFKMNYPIGQYLNTMFAFTGWIDFKCLLIKSAVFGTLIPLIASDCGFRCARGAQGVGEAATSAVVRSTILIIVADFFLTYLLYAI